MKSHPLPNRLSRVLNWLGLAVALSIITWAALYVLQQWPLGLPISASEVMDSGLNSMSPAVDLLDCQADGVTTKFL